ncbi:MAG TPA: phosphate ABC transporter permease subunit PstC, partial [Cyanobacteria bacterium UBA11049]|nr:phosphate ABC transporter permease subunit PstC [Cyanobacteria bacterium UBA11049]
MKGSKPLLEASKQFHPNRLYNSIFYWLTAAFAIGVGVLLIWITFQLFTIAFPAIQRFGLSFLTIPSWNPVEEIYGALPQIYGTLVSS